MFNAISSLINGAFGLVGKGIDWSLTKDQQELQNQYNLEMWNLNNEYNTPQNQMRRFEEAGLNPGLMYGQVNPGNSSAAPQKGAPTPPKISEDLKELGQAFNIEGLKTTIAQRKAAEAQARIAEAHADDAESDNLALERLQWNYHFDPKTGQYVFDGGMDYNDGYGNIGSKYVYPTRVSMAEGKMMKFLQDNYRANSLLVPRANLMGSQQNLNAARQRMFAPQIGMLNYQQKYFPYTFWINNAKNAVGAISPLLNFIPW